MFCPQCGQKQSDDLKFCNLCGANLQAVRQVVAMREGDEKFDWSRTWVAEMFMSEAERKRRQAQIEQQAGVTPEMKRYNEIKAGVIVSCVGIGVMVFLYNIMDGIVRSGQNPPSDAAILSTVWVAGLIPIMVGVALIINGLFVSRKMVELARRQQQQSAPNTLDAAPERPPLRSADTSEFVQPNYSVTEGTTKHLSEQYRDR
ncbi:MAG TPA: hypothetical protein VJ866_15420 [Pyrinomonadaceae bacterium]|nr:hypothetical protein [Pyrinomonadaceae bacterium]